MSARQPTRVPGFTVRVAVAEDAPLVLEFIRALAEYERLADQVRADVATLGATLFGPRPGATALIGELDGAPAAFAVYFHNFSTFVGRPGLYLEDLFVKPEFRGRGLGRAMLERLAAIARERGCGRFEWWVLDWNAPAIDFYVSLGARPMSDWTVFRVDGAALDALADAGVAGDAARDPAEPQSGLRIERAASGDVAALAPLFDAYRRFYAQPSDPVACADFLAARIERGESAVYGAWIGATPVGFMQLYPSWSSIRLKRMWHLNDLFVAPEMRQRGVADALLRAADALARATGAAYLALETAPDNRAAQALYAKHGWLLDENLRFQKTLD